MEQVTIWSEQRFLQCLVLSEQRFLYCLVQTDNNVSATSISVTDVIYGSIHRQETLFRAKFHLTRGWLRPLRTALLPNF
jgi:hypothetical protein